MSNVSLKTVQQNLVGLTKTQVVVDCIWRRLARPRRMTLLPNVLHLYAVILCTMDINFQWIKLFDILQHSSVDTMTAASHQYEIFVANWRHGAIDISCCIPYKQEHCNAKYLHILSWVGAFQSLQECCGCYKLMHNRALHSITHWTDIVQQRRHSTKQTSMSDNTRAIDRIVNELLIWRME